MLPSYQSSHSNRPADTEDMASGVSFQGRLASLESTIDTLATNVGSTVSEVKNSISFMRQELDTKQDTLRAVAVHHDLAINNYHNIDWNAELDGMFEDTCLVALDELEELREKAESRDALQRRVSSIESELQKAVVYRDFAFNHVDERQSLHNEKLAELVSCKSEMAKKDMEIAQLREKANNAQATSTMLADVAADIHERVLQDKGKDTSKKTKGLPPGKVKKSTKLPISGMVDGTFTKLRRALLQHQKAMPAEIPEANDQQLQAEKVQDDEVYDSFTMGVSLLMRDGRALWRFSVIGFKVCDCTEVDTLEKIRTVAWTIKDGGGLPCHDGKMLYQVEDLRFGTRGLLINVTSDEVKDWLGVVSQTTKDQDRPAPVLKVHISPSEQIWEARSLVRSELLRRG